MLVSQETVSRDFHTIVFDHSILYPICYECTKIIIIFVDWSWSRTAPSEVFLALRLLEKLYVTRRCPIDLASRTAFSFNWMLSSAALSCGKLNAVMDRAQLAATLSRTTLSYILKIIWLAGSFFLFFFIVNQYKIYNVLHSLCGYDACPVFFIRLKFLLLAWKLWGENKLFASFFSAKSR